MKGRAKGRRQTKDGYLRKPRLPVTAAVLPFLLAGVAGTLLIAGASFFLTRQVASSEAVRRAREMARIEGEGIIQPLLTSDVVSRAASDPAALAELDQVVRQRILDGRVARVKLWTPDGRILYSDDSRQIGEVYPLDPDELDLFRTGLAKAELSDLSKPENRYDPAHARLLEVYTPVHSSNGEPFLFEIYINPGSIAADQQRIWKSFLPSVIGGLFILCAVQLPLAVSLARRLRDRQKEREELLRQAVEASETERRRIARDLHDGVVQSLTGVSFSLAATAGRLAGPDKRAGEEVVETLGQAARVIRQTVTELRTLMVEIAPPQLNELGLARSLSDLLRPLAERGVDTELDLEGDLELSDESKRLVFRVAQEAVRNASAHSGATRVRLSLHNGSNRAHLTVDDNGRGFTLRQFEQRRKEGHIGLHLLSGLVAESGGKLEWQSEPGAGTQLVLEVPVK